MHFLGLLETFFEAIIAGIVFWFSSLEMFISSIIKDSHFFVLRKNSALGGHITEELSCKTACWVCLCLLLWWGKRPAWGGEYGASCGCQPSFHFGQQCLKLKFFFMNSLSDVLFYLMMWWKLPHLLSIFQSIFFMGKSFNRNYLPIQLRAKVKGHQA